jgi:DNA-binding response OmpR family regulator
MSLLVKMWGHEVRRTYDGAAALEMAAAYRPDVLLLDISMPKMDGCQLAKQLRRQTRFTETLLIAVTGWADNAHRLLGKEAGFDHFLPKPVEPSILEELLLLQQDRLAESPEVRLLAPWK